MKAWMRYRGREFTEAEIELIRDLIANNPKSHRTDLSRLVSERLDWRMPGGRLKDAAMRGVMLAMEKDGLIVLPARRRASGNNRKAWTERTPSGEPGIPVDGKVSDLSNLTVTPVCGQVESRLFNELISRYHYLGHKRQGGAQMRYLARTAEGRIVGCLGYSVSAWKAQPRDQWIGWNPDKREQRLHFVVNNSRFLILPWIRVPHLASKLLALTARRLPRDWKKRYGYQPLCLETFVDKSRFQGTCYRAANWIYVGDTQGRGRYDTRHEAHGKSVKAIWMYPLTRNARERLSE